MKNANVCIIWGLWFYYVFNVAEWFKYWRSRSVGAWNKGSSLCAPRKCMIWEIFHNWIFNFLMAYFQKQIGILSRNQVTNFTINLKNNKELTLNIIVENMGRLNVEPRDSKVGIEKIPDYQHGWKYQRFFLHRVYFQMWHSMELFLKIGLRVW